ncbi:hypothetical protein CFSAN002367_10189 [Clostridium botulinum CFSAN002367]|nr:hypothetical protein CFSAN002367_10189 [Clostridium botulinum CFSAN002367]
MDNEIGKYTIQIEELQKILGDYYKCFSEYFHANDNKENIYSIAHSKLIENSLKLQVCFIRVPRELQNRLLEIDFEVLLQCNNAVDFYSLREFIITNNKFYTIATIVERADAELKLALEVDKFGLWDTYNTLPKINLNFYRKEKFKSLLLENKEIQNKDIDENIQQTASINIKNNEWNYRIEQINDKPAQKMMDGFIEFMDKGDKAIDKSANIVEKSKN